MARAADEARSSLRYGVFGGSFDPPHRGHVSVAKDVADALDLDGVVWVPAARSPLKPHAPKAPDGARLEMVRAATELDARFEVSDVELQRGGPSYTVDTLRELRDGVAPEGASLFLILGIDQYRSFPGWRRPEEIRSLATLAVMDRDGEGLAAGPASDGLELDPEAGTVRVPVGRVDVSSTEVRSRVGRGERIDDLVPPAVRRIIEREGLYRR